MQQAITTFSQSPIWQLQQRYFEEANIHAWSKGEVPHYITSNPTIAKTYAELVYAFLCDLGSRGMISETVYILELGSGHGRFCYHFLKQMELLTAATTHIPPYCFVLSDFSEGVLGYWKKHERLQRFYENGQLDHCRFNALDDDQVELRISGKTISKKSLKQPLIVIANYFFDTIPQELFFVKNQQLYQPMVSVDQPEDGEKKSVREQIKALSVNQTDLLPVDILPYAEDFLNRMLQQYVSFLADETYLLLPDKGLQCIDRLRQLSAKGMMLITSDWGYHRQNELEASGFPAMAKHGSFSYGVNYHAFKTYCDNRNEIHFFPDHYQTSIQLGCLLLTTDAAGFTKTALAYQRFINNFSPDDFFVLKQSGFFTSAPLNIKEILAWTRLTNYDASIFFSMLPRIMELLPDINENDKWDLFKLVHHVWDMYYPLGERTDLAFELGVLLFNLAFYEEALAYFRLSEQLYGYGANRCFNIALCYYSTGDHASALQLSRDVFQKTPKHEKNNELLSHLETLAVV
jgi:tetratricopeptide (TPR) repeat protein